MGFLGFETDDNGNAMFQSVFPNCAKKKPAEDTVAREKNVCFSRLVCSLLYAAELALSR